MSGICGIVHRSEAVVRERSSVLLAGTTREGDTASSAVLDGASLGIASRWAYQGVARAGHTCVAVDADLTNAQELATELGISAADTPALVSAAFARWGRSALERLEGCFAVAIWNGAERELTIAIDAVGAKTLYWTHREGGFSFSSRIDAIASAFPEVGVEPRAIPQYLIFSVIPAPMTALKDVQRVEPGSYVVFRDDVVKTTRYWDLEYQERPGSEKQWADEVREGIRAAVKRTMRGLDQARTGAFLSGGTDSSSVVAFMSEQWKPVNAFSIVFGEASYSELDFARTAADRFGAKHYVKTVTADDAAEAIPKLLEYYGEPFANSSAVGGYYCAKLAKENGVDTLLAGDGGDEIFAGNERYAADKRFELYHSVPRALRKGLIEPLAQALPKSGLLALPGKYIRRANIPNPTRVVSYNLFLSTDPNDIFEEGLLEAAPASTWMGQAEAHFGTSRASGYLNRMLYMDMKITLGDNDLPKVVGTTDLAGVAVRFPFLDKKLVELASSIPANLKMKRFEKRYIFKKAMDSILPEKILYKTKHGFGVPLALWLLEHPKLKTHFADVIHDSETQQRGYFKPEFLKNLIANYDKHRSYYGEILWYVLVLELWHRRMSRRTQEVQSYAAR